MDVVVKWQLWQGCSSTRHLSGFPWAPPTQDTGRCCTRDIYWSLQAGGIRRADLVMTVAPPRVCVLMAGLSWVPWLLMHPRCAASPSQSPISLTQARWGCKPAINNTHSTNTLHISPTPNWGWGESPASLLPPPHPPSKQTEKKKHIPDSQQGYHTYKKTGLFTGFPYLTKNKHNPPTTLPSHLPRVTRPPHPPPPSRRPEAWGCCSSWRRCPSASWLQGLAGWVWRRPDSWAVEVALRRAWNSPYRYPPSTRATRHDPPHLLLEHGALGSWSPGRGAAGLGCSRLDPGEASYRRLPVAVAALPPRSSTGRRCRSGGAGAGVALLCRGWWLVWLRTALPCPVLVGGAPHWAPVWQGYSSTRHLSGFPWAPPTQDTGRCCTKIFIGVYRLVVFAELMVIWSWRWLLLECVCWWLVYPGCHDCSCTPGVQPHPAN